MCGKRKNKWPIISMNVSGDRVSICELSLMRRTLRTTCAFAPPNPNELTAAMIERLLGNLSVDLDLTPSAAAITLGLAIKKIGLSWYGPVFKNENRLDETRDSRSTLNVQLHFYEPRHCGSGPYTWLIDPISIGSPRGVPVP